MNEKTVVDELEEGFTKLGNDIWNFFPYRVQSAFIILIWLWIPGVMIWVLYNEYLQYGWTFNTFILFIPAGFFSFLGILYITWELKGKLRKRKP